MNILITGAAGLVGSHLARRLAVQHQVAALQHADLDITDAHGVYRRIEEVKPELVINCAVIQVDESEKDPAKAQAVNVDGARLLAEAANKIGAEIIHFSTQYAFEGEPVGRLPYTIADEPRPVNHYGRTKVAGELAVRAACPRSYIVRTSWVYGSGKDSFLCVAHVHLRAGKAIRAIDDIWSSTTYVNDLIDRMMTIRATGKYDTYHVVNEGVCSYHEFAFEAGRLLGLTQTELQRQIEITHECDMKRMASRPRYTPMRCLRSEALGLPPMRYWRDALSAYVKS